jgi:hypothetical protein
MVLKHSQVVIVSMLAKSVEDFNLSNIPPMSNTYWNCGRRGRDCMGESLLFKAKWAIFQLYHDENK